MTLPNTGNYTFPADINNAGTLTLSGTVSGASGGITLTNTGSLNLGISGTQTLSNIDILNDPGGSVVYDPGGVNTLTIPGSFTNNHTSGNGLFVNGGKHLIFSGAFTNNGIANTNGHITLSGAATNDGSIGGAGFLTMSGAVAGNGTFAVSNGFTDNLTTEPGGSLSPGSSPGDMDFTDDYELLGTLNIEVNGNTAAGTDYDQVRVTNVLTLGASSVLNVSVDAGYTPTFGDVITIIDAGSLAGSGAFGTENVPADWVVNYNSPNAGEVSLEYTGSAPPTPDLQFVVSEPTSGPGNTVTVEVSVNDFVDVANFQGSITFDETLLTLQSTNSPLAAVAPTVGMPGTGTIPAGTATFGWVDGSGMGQDLNDGDVIIELTFLVSNSAPEGFTPIEIGGSATPLGYAVDLNATTFLTPTLDQGGVDIDATPPALLTTDLFSNNADPAFAKVGDVVTLVFTTDEDLGVTPTVTFNTGNGAQVTSVTGSGTSWTATYTVVAGDDGVVAYVITMEDIYGNSTTTASATTDDDGDDVTIDTVDPVITCPFTALEEFDNTAGQCDGVVSWLDATATDLNLVGSPTQSAGPASGSTLNVDDVQTITYTVSDAAGNTATCSFDVVVRDTEAPVLTVPAAATSYNNDAGVCEASVDLDALTSATDNCTASPAITYTVGGSSITSPHIFAVGNHTVTATATDGSGNTDIETFDITVNDTEDPVLTVPAAATSSNNAPGVCEASVDLDLLTSATDNCTAPAITYAIGGTAITSPHTFAVGSYTVTATATDGSGNTDVATFDVTVNDTEDPVLTVPGAVSTYDNDAGLCAASVDLDLLSSATDNCAAPAITYEVGGSAITSPHTFAVGTYTVTATATDGAGNTDVATFDVTVVDNEVPVVNTQSITVQLGTDGTVTIIGEDVDNASTDNCGIASYSVSPSTFDCNSIGANPVVLTVTDIHGNVATGNATVTVENNPVVDLAGSARTDDGDLIGQVTFDLAGDNGPATQLGNNYLFTVAPCSDNNLGAALTDNSSAGIDVNDVIAIIRHTLLIEALNSEEKLIAADVNNTDNINVLDAFQVQLRILTTINSFSDPNTGAPGATVAFFPSDYTFVDPLNPWTFDTRRFYTDPAPLTGQDFTGVKLGDANSSWNPGPLRTEAPEDSLFFVTESQVAQPGELFTVPVRVRDFQAIAGYQFTLNWDPNVIALQEVRDGQLQAMYNQDLATQGMLPAVWADMAGQDISLADDEVAFELVFRAVGDWGSHTPLTFTSDVTARKAYDGEGNLLDVVAAQEASISVGAATHLIDQQFQGYGLNQAIPNPFDFSTSLIFSLGQPEEVEIEIYNGLGQVVGSFRGTYGTGSHELQWNGRNAAGAEVSEGVYFVRMRAGDFSASLNVKKMN